MNILALEPAHVTAIEAHARACLPVECCGILVGLRCREQVPRDAPKSLWHPGNDLRPPNPDPRLAATSPTRRDALQVTEVHPMPNVAAADPRNHYEIDPLAHLRLQRAARERGLCILGFYHSHPHGPATPSPTDARQAWCGYAYLIVAHGDVRPVIRCWEWHEPPALRESPGACRERPAAFREIPVRVAGPTRGTSRGIDELNESRDR